MRCRYRCRLHWVRFERAADLMLHLVGAAQARVSVVSECGLGLRGARPGRSPAIIG